MMHICVGKLTISGSDNGLSPGRRQAIIWTNAGILLIGLLGTNFSEILIEICIFSFRKMHLKMSSGKWLPFCLGLNVLTTNNGSLCVAEIGGVFCVSQVWALFKLLLWSVHSHLQGLALYEKKNRNWQIKWWKDLIENEQTNTKF